MEENKRKIALDSLQKVSEYRQNNNYGRAFAHYLVYLELSPAGRAEHERQFCDTLSNWCVDLEDRNQLEDLYKCYLQGLHYFPLSVHLLNNFGSHLLRLEQGQQAQKYLQLAHNLHPNYLPAEKNLQTTKLNLVPRWHFRMLNDRKRNRAYKNAINSAIDAKYNKVLDIGTGCGLLTLFAHQNPRTKSVCAIEESPEMADIAKNIFGANKLKNVTLINENSTDLTDIKLSNLLVTEIFDTALFGEHVLETLIHAHAKLLEADSKILPSSANVYVTGIKCQDLYKRHKFNNYNLKNLNLHGMCLNKKSAEPYEAEHIINYPHTFITNTRKITTVDFQDFNQLTELYSNKFAIPPVNLQVVNGGEIQAFVIWFELFLGDEVITTDPYSSEKCECWEQAVIYLDHPLVEEIGNRIQLRVSCVMDKLEIDVVDDFNRPPCDCVKASQDVIMFLNDKGLAESIEAASENFHGDNLVVLDLYPVPIFGLSLVPRAHVFTMSSDPDVVRKICDMNSLDVNNVTFVADDDELYKYLECKNIFDIIFFDPVCFNGTLNEKFFANFDLYENSLKDNGLFLPTMVNLNARVVASGYLDYCWRVDGGNVFGFKMEEFINAYSVPEQWILDESFKYDSLSDVAARCKVTLDDSEANTNTYETNVINSGELNGILYWFTLNFFNNAQYDTYKSTYYNRACFVRNKSPVKVGETVKIVVKQHRGLLKLSLDT